MDNPLNKLIPIQKIEEILNTPYCIGGTKNSPEFLRINNIYNYQKAFVHESYIQSVKTFCINPEEIGDIHLNYTPDEDYNRLEFLGDNQLKASQSSYIFDRYPCNKEGFYTILKIKLEQCSMLHKIAYSLGFKEYLLLSKQIDDLSILAHDIGRNTPSYYEDVFEAFIGSIILDFGEMGKIYADRFIKNLLEDQIDFAVLNATDLNYKHILQKYYQSCQWDTPVYIPLKENSDKSIEYKRIYPRILVINKSKIGSSGTITTRITDFNNKILMKYKNDQGITGLLQKYQKNSFIVGIGFGRRIIQSEQECAMMALENFDKLTSNLNI
jgi:dsRNA-specific ribonuclease